MIRIFKRAYGMGFRAGTAQPRFKKHHTVDGDYTLLIKPKCPYKGFWQMLHEIAWYAGEREGVIYRLNNKESTIIEGINNELLRDQIAVLTHVVYNRKCSKEDAEVLGGLLNLVEAIQDEIDPVRVEVIIP